MEQNRKPRGKPHTLMDLNFYKAGKNVEKTSSLTSGAGKKWPTSCKSMKSQPFLAPYAKLN